MCDLSYLAKTKPSPTPPLPPKVGIGEGIGEWGGEKSGLEGKDGSCIYSYIALPVYCTCLIWDTILVIIAPLLAGVRVVGRCKVGVRVVGRVRVRVSAQIMTSAGVRVRVRGRGRVRVRV